VNPVARPERLLCPRSHALLLSHPPKGCSREWQGYTWRATGPSDPRTPVQSQRCPRHSHRTSRANGASPAVLGPCNRRAGDGVGLTSGTLPAEFIGPPPLVDCPAGRTTPPLGYGGLSQHSSQLWMWKALCLSATASSALAFLLRRSWGSCASAVIRFATV
jgi:hypothetical protein